MTTPKYMIAHGSAAVQAARIIAAVAKEREKSSGIFVGAQDALLVPSQRPEVECKNPSEIRPTSL